MCKCDRCETIRIKPFETWTDDDHDVLTFDADCMADIQDREKVVLKDENYFDEEIDNYFDEDATFNELFELYKP